MAGYSTAPEWADVTPLPTDEGGPNPLAAIAYSEEYSETTSYLRAIMAANEYSPRALCLTQDLIEMNPAHYTVWLYRAKILKELNTDIDEELAWLNEIALRHLKNYQIWHHRQTIVERRGHADGETDFIAQMLEPDAKNYHVWSYRQWLVRRFGLWDQGELEFTQQMLHQDVRNNSAWNHRWYIVNGREAEGVPGVTNQEIREREIGFAQAAIDKAPHNQCPWNYLRGIARKAGIQLGAFKDFTSRFASLDRPDAVRSSYALDLMADILAEEGVHDRATEALELLATKYDPIRKGYWEYRKGLLGASGTAVVA